MNIYQSLCIDHISALCLTPTGVRYIAVFNFPNFHPKHRSVSNCINVVRANTGSPNTSVLESRALSNLLHSHGH